MQTPIQVLLTDKKLQGLPKKPYWLILNGKVDYKISYFASVVALRNALRLLGICKENTINGFSNEMAIHLAFPSQDCNITVKPISQVIEPDYVYNDYSKPDNQLWLITNKDQWFFDIGCLAIKLKENELFPNVNGFVYYSVFPSSDGKVLPDRWDGSLHNSKTGLYNVMLKIFNKYDFRQFSQFYKAAWDYYEPANRWRFPRIPEPYSYPFLEEPN